MVGAKGHSGELDPSGPSVHVESRFAALNLATHCFRSVRHAALCGLWLVLCRKRYREQEHDGKRFHRFLPSLAGGFCSVSVDS